MTNDPKISIIVANYNHGKYIGQSVKSLLAQTYQNFEIIIVDDCSTDNSKDVIAGLTKHDKRIVEPLFLQTNVGKWNALNQAIAQKATGELLTLQDADDASTPQRLEWTLRTLQKKKSFHTLCGFQNCNSQEEMDKAMNLVASLSEPPDDLIINHDEVLQTVYTGFKTPGINHYYTGQFETHGASSLYYKQLWDHGMKYLPGNLGLRIVKAEDSDHNTKLTLLLQKTSIVKVPFYCYRRGTTTNPAFTEKL